MRASTPTVASGIAERPMSMLDFWALLENEASVRGGRLTS
jgi:hypothetical protein